MNYQDTIDFLFSKRFCAEEFSFEAVERMALSLGSPQLSYPAVHVAGTNGKGSVCVKIAKALELAGLKVGLFTSPHLFSFCERIVVNGQPISEERAHLGLLSLFEQEKDLCFFDYATFLAFEYFREQKIDIGVIETGIGGLYDTTNIVKTLLSIITSVAYDHEKMLGNSLQEIAYQKAGIIKPKIPIVIGPHADFPVIRERAAICQSPLFKTKEVPGFYDKENCEIAKTALKLLQEKFSIKEEHIEKALEVRPLCRFQQIGRAIFDVAHNPAGLLKLMEALDTYFPNQKFSVIIGMCSDKDFKNCLKILASRASHIYLVQAASDRAIPPKKMSEILLQEEFTHFTADLSIQESIQQALDTEDLFVVCGSFYIMQQAYREMSRIEIGHSELPLIRT